jgi:proteasome lid subunit RPN8/RPN11
LGVPADSWVHELTNRAENPYDSYSIDPQTIKDLVADPEEWSSVLVWHTHPGGHVGPSQGDMRARIAGLRYLVVSLPRGEATLF